MRHSPNRLSPLTLGTAATVALAAVSVGAMPASANVADVDPDLMDQEMQEDAGDDHVHAGDFAVSLFDTDAGMKLGVSPRVLGAELSADNSFSTDEPGFDSPPGTFAPSSAIGFNILNPLSLWNGSGFDTLDPAADETLAVTYAFSAFDFARRDTADGFVEGFSIPVNDAGSWHRHLTFTLLGDGGSTDIAPDAAIYRLDLELFNTVEDVLDSDPLSIVFNLESSEDEHDSAIDFAINGPGEDPVDPVDPVDPINPEVPAAIPTPAAAWLGMSLLLVLPVRRRRVA